MATHHLTSVGRRLQALRSTGPRTSEGKLIASMNSTKHGLSKVGLRPPAEMAQAIEQRKSTWEKSYGPKGPAQRWHFDRLCAESVRLDFCEQRLIAARAEAAQRARESWDDDRNAEVAALAAKLHAQPETIQPRLLQTKHGVSWMLTRWRDLLEAVRRTGGWTEWSWELAQDLLGMPRIDRETGNPAALGVDADGPSAADRLAGDAMEALCERLEAVLIPQDERARRDAEAGLSPMESPEVRRMERYAADARRRVASHLAELRRLQAVEGGGPGSDSQTARPHPGVPVAPHGAPPAPSSGAETNSGAGSFESMRSAPPTPASRSTISLTQLLEGRSPQNRRERRARKAMARRA